MADVSGEFIQLEVDEIKVEERHRKVYGDIEILAESITRRGQLQAILITRDNVLVAGARRLQALKIAGYHFIDCQYVDETTPDSLRAIEFEENFHRLDLSWQEKCLAIVEFRESDPTNTQDSIARKLGVNDRSVRTFLVVGRELKNGNEQIQTCETIGSAYNIISRDAKRGLDTQMESLNVQLEEGDIDYEPPTEMEEDAADLERLGATTTREPRPARRDILVQDFKSWAGDYRGPRFNFIQCDFPFGLEHGRSVQGGAARHGAYEDSPETYWELLDVLLANADRVVAESAHVMFWLSLNQLEKTTLAFSKSGFRVDPFPLIWYKSDNTGIIPDTARGPRRVYEAALHISRGDRKIVRSVSNLIAIPARKAAAEHLSEKPQAVLEHFFGMYVDSNTIFLDPTCGSGTSLRAADEIGALKVLGMDIDPGHVGNAQIKLDLQRLDKAKELELDDGLDINIGDPDL